MSMSNHRSLPKAKKRFGQNFLVDPTYAEKIVELAEISTGDTVVEIGPGQGAITSLLAKKDCRVYALELDRTLHEHLEKEFAKNENVSIISGDALNYDFTALGEQQSSHLKIVANLPYNVATPILFRLLDSRSVIEKMVLMFQKEVAERIIAEPGSKQYGALSIFPQLYTDTKMEFILPPGAFRPTPKVQSAVLSFNMLEKTRYPLKNEKILRQLAATVFSQRRKKVINGLSLFTGDKEEASRTLEVAGISPDTRPDSIGIEDYCRLSDVLSET